MFGLTFDLHLCDYVHLKIDSCFSMEEYVEGVIFLQPEQDDLWLSRVALGWELGRAIEHDGGGTGKRHSDAQVRSKWEWESLTIANASKWVVWIAYNVCKPLYTCSSRLVKCMIVCQRGIIEWPYGITT